MAIGQAAGATCGLTNWLQQVRFLTTVLRELCDLRVRQVEGRENFGEGGQDVNLDGAVYRSGKGNVHFGNTEAEPVLFQ